MSAGVATFADLQPWRIGPLSLSDPGTERFLKTTGLSGVEKPGRWTNGKSASLSFKLPPNIDRDIIIKIAFSTFVVPGVHEEQRIVVELNGSGSVSWCSQDRISRVRALLVEKHRLGPDGIVLLDLKLPDCAAPADLGLNADRRLLGIMLHSLSWQLAADDVQPDGWLWQLGRPVGGEARKTFDQKIESGFWERFITGPNVLDVGFRGYAEVKGVVPITPTAIGLDLDYPGYDGRTLPFADESQDAVYSSHCLEHISDFEPVLREWHRVTRIGGHIITVVPHAQLYERALRPPSLWNRDHKRFYTPASLLAEFEAALKPNTFRVRLLEDNDLGYAYQNPADTHPFGCYEIVLVIQKIAPPPWAMHGQLRFPPDAAAQE